MYESRGEVITDLTKKKVDNVLILYVGIVFLAVLLTGLSLVVANVAKDVEKLEETSKVETVERECLDYTLREYREGEAPEKCATEVYGDQF